ncbi:MAG: phosphotransferase [Actinomycetota bacterium]|nr:phosphotransferase [Actinomycetota bacterium]
MQPDDKTTAAANARFTEWMHLNLDHAADHFGLKLTGEPVLGWRLRTIGAPATGDDGPRWLRVVTEFPEWARGDTWTGNADANTITGIPKPRVLDVLEWDEQSWRHQRAEVATLLPGTAISPTNQLRAAVDLPDTWWAELRRSIDTLRAIPTSRVYTDQARISERTRDAFGAELHVGQWETVHGDLHWENLLAPQLGLLDWELWGRGPAGTDAATLLLHSLLIPTVAKRVHATFADLLDTEAGQTAQLAVAARLLSRIAGGDYAELTEPLHRHVRSLGGRLAPR